MTEPLAVFRASASPQVGGGHVVRCLALAHVLRDRGWRCLFASGPETAVTVPMVSAFDILEISETNAAAEPALIADRLGADRADALIIDHYERGAAFETPARAWARCIVVLDDIPNRRHDADLLLDQSGGREAAPYGDLVAPACRLLVGPRYALLRAQFCEGAPVSPVAGAPLRVFVSMGATDATNLTAAAVAVVRAIAPAAMVDVMLSSGAPHLAALRAAYDADPHVAIHIDVADPAGLIGTADLAAGTAGINLWERCALGVPSLIHVAAENQRANAMHVAAHGGGLVLGDGDSLASDVFGDALAALVDDPAQIAEMAEHARHICDGRGAHRLADAIEELARG